MKKLFAALLALTLLLPLCTALADGGALARGTGANVRSAPSSSAAYPWVARNGETLTVLAVREDGWLHVNYQGMGGFVRGELVTPTISWEKQ